ncbi:MAG: YebC/PmpR family DNA-binding transcriptional regulator, partial [Gemmatimonadota bacterium]
GRIFAKLSREIAVAAREKGGDPEYNARLRTAIENAEAENMPKENIERAIKRGTGELEGVDYHEYSLEGYGPGGAALFLECLTDNENRTVQEVRHLLETHGGNLGRDGSVAWMFERKGRVLLDADRYDGEAVLEAAVAAGAEDMRRDGDVYEVLTSTGDFHEVQEGLEEQGLDFEEARLVMVPETTMEVDGSEAGPLLDLLEELEDHDDVQHVYSNLELDEDALDTVEVA